MSSNDETVEILLDTLTAIDGSLNTLMMARTIINDRIDRLQHPRSDKTETLTSRVDPSECRHDPDDRLEKPIMGGHTLVVCNACGEMLN